MLELTSNYLLYCPIYTAGILLSTIENTDHDYLDKTDVMLTHVHFSVDAS